MLAGSTFGSGCAEGPSAANYFSAHDAGEAESPTAPQPDAAVDMGSDGQDGGCAPMTCEQANAQCGRALDGCGAVLDCGGCPQGQLCGGGGPNRCGNNPCTPQTCSALAASCGMVYDGCSDVLSCGECEAPETCGGASVANQCGCTCTAAHAQSTTCSHGVCAIAACEPGWFDCDAAADNGCEADINTDPQNCSECGKACSFQNAEAKCATGKCGLGACHTGFGNCDNDDATGCEANTKSDPNNCASCGTVCPAPAGTPVCTDSVCGISNCEAGFGDCDGIAANGCETNLNASADNCGYCGNLCTFANAVGKCVQQICAIDHCSAGWGNCDGFDSSGCETNFMVSPDNCGTCGHQCPSEQNADPACASSNCAISCHAGYEDCDGSFANGCEADTSTDPDHCGNCSTHCQLPHATSTCSANACVVVSCTSPYGDCDLVNANGCETNLMTETAHCSTCNHDCGSGHACSGGQCVCLEAWTCGTWSSCGCSLTHTRVCTDANSCGTTTTKPPESETCDPCVGKNSGKYCGATTQFGGCAGTLYTCTSGVTSTSQVCTNGCHEMPAGSNDYCNP